jgi:hypothetical protein
MFDALLDAVDQREKRFIIYRGPEHRAIDPPFENHAVDVETRTLPPVGPAPFLVIEDEGTFAGAIGLDALDGILEPPIRRPGDIADHSRGYRVLFEVLDETVFTAMGRRELLAVSREIEDRAFRTGAGTLHGAFQRYGVFRSQIDVYRHLAVETTLDVHIYGQPDWSPPEIEGVTYHDIDADPLARYWALAFDGGPEKTQASGLLARERENSFEGFWTDSPTMVGDLLAGFPHS